MPKIHLQYNSSSASHTYHYLISYLYIELTFFSFNLVNRGTSDFSQTSSHKTSLQLDCRMHKIEITTCNHTEKKKGEEKAWEEIEREIQIQEEFIGDILCLDCSL